MKASHFEEGTFFVGCNYWASHAGMFMWSDWNEQIIEDDFHHLAEAKITTLRMFPLWSDFQPLRMHMGAAGTPREVRRQETPLAFDEAGRAGVDPVMLERFGRFCDLAEKYHLKLIVGLLTGWMSGRLFVPEMLQNRNILTDPLALEWEIRFVRLMVRTFRNKPAILAWDLGNECNCLGEVKRSEEAYLWASTISMAIRYEDAERPIISGMHSLAPDGRWRMQDQAEFLDLLTTHPYPIFTPHCDTDPLNQMKSALHATAESLYYADLGGKPCFAEEVGTLGPMVASDELAADYIRASLFTLFAHDCRAMLWWCGFEQSELTPTPYDWNGVERELGLFYLDKSPKPVVKVMTAFSEFVESLPFEKLPPRITDAVCILTRGQDTWAVAYGAFLMAKQAHLDLRFAWADGFIPEAKAYLVPSLTGDTPMNRSVIVKLMERVRQGAKLYLSLDGALLSPFTAFTGVHVLTRAHNPQMAMVRFGERSIRMVREFRLHCESAGAEVLSHTEEGEIAFAKNRYGQGEVYTLLFPIEQQMATIGGMADSEDAQPAHLLYSAMDIRCKNRIARIENPTIGLTEHRLNEQERILILINYEPYDQEAELHLEDGWFVQKSYSLHQNIKVETNPLAIPHNQGVLLILKKEAN